MRGNAVKTNSMAKKKTSKVGDEKPLTFKQAITLAANTPHLTHKQIDELRKQGKLKDIMKK